MVRAFGLHPKGQRFESSRVHIINVLCFMGKEGLVFGMQAEDRFTLTYPLTEITVFYGTTAETCPIKAQEGQDIGKWVDHDIKKLDRALNLAALQFGLDKDEIRDKLLEGEEIILEGVELSEV